MRQKGFAPIMVLVLVVLAVIGYFSYKDYWPKVQTAKWKTYTNKKYLFEFKHPNNWVLQTVDMRSDNQYFLHDPLNQLTPIDIIVNLTSDIVGKINKGLLNYEVDKLPAYRKINKNSQGDITQEITYFEHGNYTYTMVVTYENKFDQKLQNIYNQILSTFKFTE